MKVNCKYCGKSFEISEYQFNRGRGKYCNKECYYNDHRVNKICNRCGEKFKVVKKRAKISDYKYCPKCYGKKIDIKCKYCGKLFRDYEINNRIYCSIDCKNKGMMQRKMIKCKICGKEFELPLSKTIGRGIYCSNECYKISLKGDGNPSWRGGKKYCNEYILIYSPKHSFKNKKNYIYKHRAVMEKSIGRFLKEEEVVHHINGDKTDNRLENLRLFSNQSEHRKYHHSCKEVVK